MDRRTKPAVLYFIAAAILVVGLVTAGVIALTKPATSPSPGRPVPGQVAGSQAEPTTTTTRSSTCAGWATVKMDMEGMTKLPDGWTYDTPLIDIAIHGRATQLDTVVKLFIDKISPEPTDLAATARAWVDAQSVEGPKLTNHTFTADDRARIEAAAHALDVACSSG